MNLTPEVAAYLAKARHALEVVGKLTAGGDLALAGYLGVDGNSWVFHLPSCLKERIMPPQ
jgi:hypothetical protein